MTPTSRRFLALDVFRGLAMALMILVNSPGSWAYAYDPLKHAAWHGFTAADLVFPSFLFAVGTALSFSMAKFRGHHNVEVLFSILKRTSLLFLLGFFMHWYPFFQVVDGSIHPFPISETRIFGVLQRIALCYGVVATLLWFAGERMSYIIGGLGLLGYWGVMALLGAPGDPYSLEGNVGLRVDLALIGPSHLYQGEGIPFDPEGLLSTLPALANVLAGYALGQWVRRRGSGPETLIKFLLLGGLSCIVAYGWDLLFPINKKLWTSSYVLWTVGLDIMAMSLLLALLPANSTSRPVTQFFEVFGKNPLAIYLLSEMLLVTLYVIPLQGTTVWPWVYATLFQPMGSALGSLGMAVGFMLICWGLGYGLHTKRWYWRV